MALDRDTRDEILQFVKQEPRNINEVAEHISMSWRTADRYLEQIEDEDGSIRRKTFREGTRGALKIVYWDSPETITSNSIQEQLLRKIETGRTKDEFSPFDIYQVASSDQRTAFAEQPDSGTDTVSHDILEKLREAQDEIKFFSGDLSWSQVHQQGEQALDVFEELASDGITVRFIGRVDIESITNTDQLLQINSQLSEDRISVRHTEQPLRAVIIDGEEAQLKEVRDSGSTHDTHLFYNIEDPEWVQWLDRVFWKLYRGGIPADRRLEDLQSIQNISTV